jgi:hypothetical protein
MRIVVVLPRPFAPRNPQISPAATWRLKPSTTFSLPTLLRNPADVDDVVKYGGPAAGVTVTGWPGSSGAAFVFGEKDELAAVRFGISEGGVHLAYGNEGNGPAQVRRTVIALKCDFLADVGARELGLRNEEVHEDLFRGAAATPPALWPPASRPAVQGGRRRFLRRARRPSADLNAIRPDSVRLEANRPSTSEPRFPPACPLAQWSTPTSKVRYCAADPLALGRAPERREDSLEPGLSRRS